MCAPNDPMNNSAVAAYDKVADIYDQWTGTLDDTAPTVSYLAEHGKGGRVLELGSGTGRVLVPLAQKGVDVSGVEGSPRMVQRMRVRAGTEKIPVEVGDMAELPERGAFDLVYCVFNTFYCLLEQEKQVRCLRNVAERLAPDGIFVFEAGVPDQARTDSEGQRVATGGVRSDRVFLEATTHDQASQRVWTQMLEISEKGTQLYPLRIRYVWPSELDLMARLAGLRLVRRSADWEGSPFTSTSRRHVSVFRRQADDP